LPEKYNTLITEDALNFSGGQKQRLDLARALVKKSQILILDEPTSNLDAESTKIFNESLKKILDTKEVTVIVVTHYFKDIIDADKIFVMNNGTISSEGKHADLIKIDNWYNKSWKIQDGRGD
jgi:ABC-type multidrug transport system fused ATPase/permease subunit